MPHPLERAIIDSQSSSSFGQIAPAQVLPLSQQGTCLAPNLLSTSRRLPSLSYRHSQNHRPPRRVAKAAPLHPHSSVQGFNAPSQRDTSLLGPSGPTTLASQRNLTGLAHQRLSPCVPPPLEQAITGLPLTRHRFHRRSVSHPSPTEALQACVSREGRAIRQITALGKSSIVQPRSTRFSTTSARLTTLEPIKADFPLLMQ